jgi:hypothetical protein
VNTVAEPGVPRWVWWTAAGVAVGSIIAVTIGVTRAPSYDRLLARTGAPRELKTLEALQRYTESRGNHKTGLGRPELFPWWAEPRDAPREQQDAESAAAAAGYDRNAESYGESPYPRRMWVFGSGGPHGLIPSSALAPWRNTDALRRGKVSPYDVFDRWRSMVFFVDYVHRLLKRPEFRSLPAAHRTILALKRGLASPELLTDTGEHEPRSRSIRRRAIEAAQAQGIDEDELYTQVPLEWPDYPSAQELVP